MTQAIIKHDLRCRFSVNFGDQMAVFRYAIPVQVYQNLYRWILFQNRFQPLSCIVICFAPVKFPSSQIKCFRYMHNLVSIIFCQKLSQIIPHPHDRIFCLSFSGICKSLLRMTMIDQNLWLRFFLTERQILPKKSSRIQLLRTGFCIRIKNKKMIHQIIVICQSFRCKVNFRHRLHLSGCRSNFLFPGRFFG